MSVKGIILAAGRGSRMGTITDTIPKCLVSFEGKSLLEHQLAALSESGIEDVVLVTGYKADSLKDYTYQTFHNSNWDKTNIVGSLFSAYSWLKNFDCIVSYSDIVYGSEVVRALLQSDAEVSVAYDPEWLKLWKKRFSDPLSDAETFKLSNDFYLTEIGKKTKKYEDIQGQYMGLLKFKRTVWDTIDLESYGHLDMTSFLQLLIQKNFLIRAVKNEKFWAEIDSLSDLLAVEKKETSQCKNRLEGA